MKSEKKNGNMKREVALTIAGSDSGAGAGIQADLKTFSALNVFGVTVITALTAQNTQRVLETFTLPKEFVEAQLKAIHEDFEVKSAKTGMLATEEIIKTVCKNIGEYPLVVDPVMVSETGYKLIDDNAIEALKNDLLPKATLVTPNIREASILADIEIKDIEDMKKACKKISEYCDGVLIKGSHLPSKESVDILFLNGKFYEFSTRKLDKRTHGSGCTFSAAIAAYLAKGYDIVESIRKAKKFIFRAISEAEKIGKGVEPVYQFGSLFEGYYRYRVLEDLRKALEKLKRLNIEKVLPEVGINIVYAIPNAKSIDDVAGVRGRINKYLHGDVYFGASNHVARIVLAAMKYNPEYRSAMNIKYDKKILEICEKLGYTVSSFSREEEPENVSTMEWGTKTAIERVKDLGMPDIIYDLGAVGKEPMIRILGRNPEEVLRKLENILNYY